MYSYAAPVLAVGLILFDVTVTFTAPSAYLGAKREDVQIHWMQCPYSTELLSLTSEQ